MDLELLFLLVFRIEEVIQKIKPDGEIECKQEAICRWMTGLS